MKNKTFLAVDSCSLAVDAFNFEFCILHFAL